MISPEVGRNAPEIKFIIVVLPEPFGPISPSTSFWASDNDILSTATRPPKRFVTPVAVSAAVVVTSSMRDVPPQHPRQRSGR